MSFVILICAQTVPCNVKLHVCDEFADLVRQSCDGAACCKQQGNRQRPIKRDGAWRNACRPALAHGRVVRARVGQEV